MRWGIVAVTVAVLLTAGCSKDTEGGGLTARLLDQVGDGFDGVSAGPNHLYALGGSQVYPLDSASGEPSGASFTLDALKTRRAVAEDGAIWFTSTDAKPPNRRVAPGGRYDELVLPGDLEGAGVAVSGETGWVMAPFDRKAVPFTEDGVAGKPVDIPCDTIVVNTPLVGSDGAVWTYCEKGVARIDTDDNSASLVDIGGRPTGLALTSSTLWAARDGTLYAIDPDTGEITNTVDRPEAQGLAGDGDDLWVTGGGITLHSGSDGRQVNGPVSLPSLSDQVGSAISEMAAFGGRLFLTLQSYGAPLVMVQRAG